MHYKRNADSSSRIKDNTIDHVVSRFRLFTHERRQAEASRSSQVITISRQLGAGGRRVAEALGESFGWPLYDKEILEVLAQQSSANYQARMFEALDERVHGEIEGMLHGLLGHADQSAYFYLLPKAILTLAQTDCVILGRGAYLLLPNALRIRIEASLDTRTQNMMRFEGMPEEQARHEIAAADRNRKRFLRHLMSLIPESKQWYRDHLFYDLVVNTDHCSVEDAAAIVMTVTERRFGVSPRRSRENGR